MIICSKCNTENEDDVKFCKECGNALNPSNPKIEEPTQEELKELANKLNEQVVHTEKRPFNLERTLKEFPKKIFNAIKNSVFFRKKKNTIITFSSILAAILVVVFVLNSGYLFFVTTYNLGKYDMAKQSYTWSINSESVKRNIDKFLIGKMEGYYEAFRDEKITYEESIKQIEIANKIVNHTEAKTKIDMLQNSRSAFSKAQEYEKNAQLLEAILQYINVIEEDKNYSVAQERIQANKDTVKAEVIIKLDNCLAVNDFEGGLKLVSDVSKLFENDAQLNNYKVDFETRKENHRIQKLKDEQKVKVIKAYAYNGGYYSIFREARVIVQNCSDSVIKEFTVGILQFDNNGYPVEVEYSIYGEDNCYRGRADSANVLPGETYGHNTYWSIADDATQIKACVIKAEFYNGEIWYNPYYDYWKEQEEDRF